MELRVCHTCRAVRPGATLCPGCSGTLAVADARLFVGDTFGKYSIDDVLGAGGMGVVYRATHRTLRRSVALKVVVPRVADASFERRFLREARVLAELKHPHIVEIYDFDVNPWGLPYYVMEHLEGCTLRTLIGSAPGGLPDGALAALLEDVAAGLAFAHRKGVVHRDLKPDNVFVARYDGRTVAKLLDFGIAKLLSETDDTTTLTAAGAIIGTPYYLAPEQILAGTVGPFTDQYALALIVAEALSGRAVRAGRTLMHILAEDIHHPADLAALPVDAPPARREALRRATLPDAAARFPDVTAFVAALALPAPDRAALATQVLESLLPPTAGARHTGTLDGSGPTPPSQVAELTGTLATAAARTGSAPASSVTGTQLAEAPPTAASTRPSPAPAVTPTASAPRTRALLALGLTAALLVAGTGVWRARRAAPPADARATTASLVSPQPRLRRVLTLPPDTTGLLALEGDTLALAADSALYLQRLDGEQAPTRIALGDGQAILGRAQEGGVWLRDGARLLRLDPFSQKKTPWLERLPASTGPAPGVVGRVHVSPAGRYVALVEPRRIAVCEVVGSACVPRYAIDWQTRATLTVRLSDAYLAVAQGLRTLDVYRAADGHKLLQAPLDEARVDDVALLDDAGRVAVGGWFPHVDVHDLASGAPPVRVARQGQTTRLAWIADAPTLLLAGPSGTQLWRAAGGLRDVADGRTERGGGQRDDVLVTARAIAVFQGDTHRVALFDYDGFAPTRRLKLGNGSVWAVQAEAASRRVFAGSADGTLYAYDPGAQAPAAFKLHGDGVTDLALGGGALASTSDDKTLAVWLLPALSVTWRSRAHDFLVNQLALAGDPPSLWSSSSDGVVKRWGWPQPDEQESLDTRRLVPGAAWALHALWVSPDGARVLAGTWQRALLELRRAPGGAWSGRRLPVESQALYRALGLPDLDAVLFVGLYPSRVALYDLRSGRLEPLPSFGLSTYTAAPGDERGEAFVLGEGAALRYVVRREADGTLACDVSARVATGLGVALSAAHVAPHTLVAGLETGEIAWLDTKSLTGPPLARVTLSTREPQR